jgi:hypothetical protein
MICLAGSLPRQIALAAPPHSFLSPSTSQPPFFPSLSFSNRPQPPFPSPSSSFHWPFLLPFLIAALVYFDQFPFPPIPLPIHSNLAEQPFFSFLCPIAAPGRRVLLYSSPSQSPLPSFLPRSNSATNKQHLPFFCSHFTSFHSGAVFLSPSLANRI